MALTAVACGAGSGKGDRFTPGPGGSPATVDATHARGVDPQDPLGKVTLRSFAGRFTQPVGLVAVPGAARDVVVVEKGGRLVLVRDGRTAARPFLDLTGQVSTGAEQGLLSVAFAPDYSASGRAYVFLTDPHGDVQILEYRRGAPGPAGPDQLDPATRRPVLTVREPYPNHNGGQLLFDRAGMLLIGLGDGGDENDPAGRAQDLNTLLGKILRIDPRAGGGKPYRIPADNPFVGRTGVRPEIWASGLRNPWRFALDEETGTLVVGDVGQYAIEELDLVAPEVAARGGNYGWSVFEGDQDFRTDRRLVGVGPLIRPALVYQHSDGACSITVGGVYRGSAAALRGSYIYGDFCTGDIIAAPPAPADGTTGAPRLGEPRRLSVRGGAVAAFGTDGSGEMYVVDLAGRISRLAGAEAP